MASLFAIVRRLLRMHDASDERLGQRNVLLVPTGKGAYEGASISSRLRRGRLKYALAGLARLPLSLAQQAASEDGMVARMADRLDSYLTFFDMQARAIEAGIQAAAKIAGLVGSNPGLQHARLHFIGHSFAGGARVLPATARLLRLAGAPARSGSGGPAGEGGAGRGQRGRQPPDQRRHPGFGRRALAGVPRRRAAPHLGPRAPFVEPPRGGWGTEISWAPASRSRHLQPAGRLHPFRAAPVNREGAGTCPIWGRTMCGGASLRFRSTSTPSKRCMGSSSTRSSSRSGSRSAPRRSSECERARTWCPRSTVSCMGSSSAATPASSGTHPTESNSTACARRKNIQDIKPSLVVGARSG